MTILSTAEPVDGYSVSVMWFCARSDVVASGSAPEPSGSLYQDGAFQRYADQREENWRRKRLAEWEMLKDTSFILLDAFKSRYRFQELLPYSRCGSEIPPDLPP